MKTIEFAFTSIRLLGLAAIFNGARHSMGVLVYIYSTNRSSAPMQWNHSLFNFIYISIFPIVVGIICLAYTEQLSRVVTKGIERVNS